MFDPVFISQRYASEVDIDFVRKAVRSIGRLAIKVEAAADSCIQVLLTLMESKVSYVVQEAVIVTKDIFRRYPGKYEGIIPKLCETLDSLEEPEAKSSMIWILGQFANRIDNADELLDDLVYTFLDESVEVCALHICSFFFHAEQKAAGSIGIANSDREALHLQTTIRLGQTARS
jgi:AP-2 complex subunit beta-1